jgi:signal transduction histidine kinase
LALNFAGLLLNKKKIFIILILTTPLFIKGQDFNSHIQLLKTNNLEGLDVSLLTKRESLIENIYLSSQIKIIEDAYLDSLFILKLNNIKIENKRDLVLNSLILGDYSLFKINPEDSLALSYYNVALKKSLEIKDTILAAEGYKKILQQLSQNRKSNKITLDYINYYKKILYDDHEKATYKYYKFLALAGKKNKEQIDSLKKGLEIANKTKNNFLKAKYNQMIGVFFSYFKKQVDSSLFYTKKAKNILEKKNYKLYENELFGIYGNIGQAEDARGNYIIAREYYKKANKIKIPKYRYLVKVKLNEVLAKNANKRNLKDSAYFYLKQSNLYKDTLNEFKIKRTLLDLDKKYKTAEKEKQILIERQKNIKNKNLLIGSLLFILLGGTIGILSLKNSKRKRKVAEQQKELETQKNLTLLKEQELTTINAMVDGQEKERKRIAEDLHDNLGSVLATLKLHFENLKINREKKKIDQDTLFNKTEHLIDEAYLKVRSIAHAKNAGVIANQGLLVAIKMMAEKISSADKIKIEVIDYGLNKRLDNSLEINVFRITQELITNIIKHANAKNATINISLYDKNLNIIIEDDGKGFDLKKVNLKNGMGITSIKTRVKHLEGTFEVDSTIGKGSSIIIDIPIS